MDKASGEVGTTIDLTLERTVAGGLGFARDLDGRVVLVDGGLPGELVRAEILDVKARLLRARVTKVLTRSGSRVMEPCPEVAKGCGGCDLQHADPSSQQVIKAAVVADSLLHVGRLRGVPILRGRPLPMSGFRTTLRCAVEPDSKDGRLGFRRRHSTSVHAVDACMVAHPLVDEIVRSARFPGATEVTIRAGAGTGERLVIVDPSASEVDAAVGVPDGVEVIGADALRAGIGAYFHEIVAGRSFRISARSFFQSRPDGAEVLIDAVRRALGSFDAGRERLVDMYGGVGLFTGALGAQRSVVVERSKSSAADAEVNLADLGASVLSTPVERWRPSKADAVVADPARSGLGKDGVRAIVATGASRVALVSCDPASLARDSRLLVDGGYRILGVELVDMFPNTHHIEAVATLRLK